MKTKTLPVVAFIAAGALAVAGWMLFTQADQRETAEPETARVRASEPPDATPPLNPARESLVIRPPAVDPAGSRPAVAATPQPGNAAPPAATPAPAPQKKAKQPLQDPTARAVMRFVGIDPEAEGYWREAIFNPNLPAKEREDLMEDLNEVGLSDPKRPGPEDLLLIMNRIAIVEKIIPDADAFMQRHLREAHKDLVNLAAIIQGQGKPVR